MLRPTTPYSNNAAFEAVGASSLAAPIGLANVAERLNDTAK